MSTKKPSKSKSRSKKKLSGKTKPHPFINIFIKWLIFNATTVAGAGLVLAQGIIPSAMAAVPMLIVVAVLSLISLSTMPIITKLNRLAEGR